MGDDLAVRLRRKGLPLRLTFFAQFLGVLDDTVVHHRDAAIHMGVRVAFARSAVRRPAGVRNADVSLQGLSRRSEPLHPPLALCDLQFARRERRNARRIVPAVLQFF